MINFLSVVPIIIPSDPAVRAAVAEDLRNFGEWLLLGIIFFAIFTGLEFTVKGIIHLIRYIKLRRYIKRNERKE